MKKKRFHVSGTVTFNFIGHVDVFDDESIDVARTTARDSLHDGMFAGSYDIADQEIDVDPSAEEIE